MREKKMIIRSFQNRKGITLIELLIGLVISAIVVAGVYRVFVSQTKAYTVQDQVVEVQQNIRSAMEILLRDLRMAGYDNDSLTSKIAIANPIVPADHSVTVNYEHDDTHRYQVAYRLNNGTLERQLDIYTDTGLLQSSNTETILENVEAFNFRYGVDTIPNIDGAVDNWVFTAGIGPSKIIATEVFLQARPETAGAGDDRFKMVMPRILTTRVALRNLCLR